MQLETKTDLQKIIQILSHQNKPANKMAFQTIQRSNWKAEPQIQANYKVITINYYPSEILLKKYSASKFQK